MKCTDTKSPTKSIKQQQSSNVVVDSFDLDHHFSTRRLILCVSKNIMSNMTDKILYLKYICKGVKVSVRSLMIKKFPYDFERLTTFQLFTWFWSRVASIFAEIVLETLQATTFVGSRRTELLFHGWNIWDMRFSKI